MGIKNKEFIIFILSFIIIAFFTKSQGLENDISRLATVESLVERNTFIIDSSSLMPNVDKVYIDGQYYSDKPPLFSFLSAGIYLIFFYVFGLSFSNNPLLGYYLMTLLIVGVLSALMIMYFYKSLKYIKLDEGYRIIITIGLLIGTLILPYSLIFNNQIVAASLLFISFYLLLIIKFENKGRIYFFISGLMASLAAMVDLVSGGIFLILFTIYALLLKKSKDRYLFLLGIIIPIILHIILNFNITGDLVPINLHPNYFNFTESRFNQENLSGFFHYSSLNGVLIYFFHILIGKKGIFLYNPVLILSLLFLFKTIFDKKIGFSREAIFILIGIVITVIYYTLFTNNFGGESYGMRWFVSFIPLLYFFSCFIFIDETNKVYRYIYYITFFISFIFSIIGIIGPWENLFDIYKTKTIQLRYFLRRG